MKYRRGISGNSDSGGKRRHASSDTPSIADRVDDAIDDHAATAAAVERERRIVASLEAQLALLRRVGCRKRRRSSTTTVAASSRGRGRDADARGPASLTPHGNRGGDRRRPKGTGGDVGHHRPRGQVGRTPAREDGDVHVVDDDVVDGPPRRHDGHAAADGEAGGRTMDGPGSDGEQRADGEEMPGSLGEIRRYGDVSRCARNLLDVLDMLGSQSTRAAKEAVAGTLNSSGGVGSSYRYVANPRAVRIAPLASGVYFTDVRVVPVQDVDSQGTGHAEGKRFDHGGERNAPEAGRLRRTRYDLWGAVLPQVGDLTFRIDVTAALPRKSTSRAGESDRASEEARVEALAVKFMRKDRAVAHEEKERADGVPSGVDDGDTSPTQETASASSSSMKAGGTLAQAPVATASVLNVDTSSVNGSPDRLSKPEQHHRHDCQNYFPSDELNELTGMMTTTSPICGGGSGGDRTNVPRLVRAIVTFAEFDSKRRRALCRLRLRYGDDRLHVVSAHEFHVRILAPPPRTPRPPGGDTDAVGGGDRYSGNVVKCVLCLTWRWKFSLCGRGKERLTLEDVVYTFGNHEKPSGSSSGDRVSSMEEITDDNLQRLVSSVGGDGSCELAIDGILQATSFQ